MNAIFRHPGRVIDYTPIVDVAAGTVIVQNDMLGISQAIQANRMGSLHIDGVFWFPKAVGILAVGTKVYWNSVARIVQDSSASGAYVRAGLVTKAASTSDLFVEVLLVPGLDAGSSTLPTGFTLSNNLLLYSGTADSHYTDGGGIGIEYESSGKRTHSLLRCDFSALIGQTVSLASLFADTLDTGDISRGMRARRVTSAWTPSQVTWNSASTGVPWTLAGGDFTTTDQVAWNAPGVVGRYEIPGWGPLVQDAITNRAGILNAILMLDVEAGAAFVHRIRGKNEGSVCVGGINDGLDCVIAGDCPGGVCTMFEPEFIVVLG